MGKVPVLVWQTSIRKIAADERCTSAPSMHRFRLRDIPIRHKPCNECIDPQALDICLVDIANANVHGVLT